MSSLEHRREMPRRDDPFGPPGRLLAGLWMVPLAIFVGVVSLGIFVRYIQ
jgi:hypothetical protein